MSLEDKRSLTSIIDVACDKLNKSDEATKILDYIKSEWIANFDDLYAAISDTTIWATLKIPARLKIEISAVVNELISDNDDNDTADNESTKGFLLPYEHERKMQHRLESNVDDIISDLQERTRVVVRVPATSANLGPGFDAIGMALDMWSEFTVERSDKFEMICEGEGASDMPLDETNLVCMAVATAFEKAGKPVPMLKYHLVNRIPYARGLGSSSAAIVGGLVAGLILAGHQVKAWGGEDLLNMAADIEGHPDNVAPAIYGGIQLGIHTGDRWMTERVNLPPGLQCVAFIPDKIGKTSTARGVLGDTISRKDAVFNITRVAWLINALASNNIDQLRYGVEDALHQPQRAAAVYPHLMPIIDAAVQAGASAAYLSGAGPTVMAITSGASGDIFTQRTKERVDRKVAEAMLKAASLYSVKGEVFITAPVEHGAVVVSAEPAFSTGQVRYRDDV